MELQDSLCFVLVLFFCCWHFYKWSIMTFCFFFNFKLVVGLKNCHCCRLLFGAWRENITAHAVCSASGVVFDPLIVLVEKKNMLSTQRGNNAFPSTHSGISMVWYLYSFVKESNNGLYFLLFDGHLSHASVRVIKKAMQEHISSY